VVQSKKKSVSFSGNLEDDGRSFSDVNSRKGFSGVYDLESQRVEMTESTSDDVPSTDI